MGFIKAFKDSLGGTFADQWLDFYRPVSNVSATAGVFPAVLQSTNNGRGSNYKGNNNIITNGSKILVPEGTALITLQDGGITSLITEPGGYIFQSDDVHSKSIFAGDGLGDAILKSTWEKVKFGGQPDSQQLAFYVNLKEIPNNRFGTQAEIYWDDAFLGTQVGAMTRGTYTIQIVNPLLFIKNFVPTKYLVVGAPIFDFADMDNDAATQLFNEVVGSLSAAFSIYTNDPNKQNRMSKIQGDQIGFAKVLGHAVEEGYQWTTDRGLAIVKTSILSIEYDADTKALMKDVKKADALAGARGNSFMQQAAARGIQAAGEKGGGVNMAMMGMGMGATGNMMNNMQQPETQSSYQPNFGAQATASSQNNAQQSGQGGLSQDPMERLMQMKKLFDAGVLTEEEFNQAKKQILGL